MKHATKTETDSGDPAKDFALDAMYREAVRVAKEFGWPVTARAEFEARYREEVAALQARDSE